MSSAPVCTVAVIEDDEAMRSAIRRLLKAEGYAAEQHACAEDFLAAGTASHIRCLVLDIGLPGMSGIDLYRRLASAGTPIPTVFITARDDTSVRDFALREGACLLHKPFPGEALVDAVSRSIGHGSA